MNIIRHATPRERANRKGQRRVTVRTRGGVVCVIPAKRVAYQGERMDFKSARQIWHDAFHTEVGSIDPMASPGTRDGNDNRIWGHVLKGKAQSLIESLPALENGWGMYAYTDIFTKSHHSRILNYLLESVRSKAVTYDQTKRLLTLIEALTMDFKVRLIRGTGMYSQANLSEMMGIKPSNYRKSWGDIEASVIALLDGMDQRALAPLSRLIDAESPKLSTGTHT